jgi:RHS repeat-associated protein
VLAAPPTSKAQSCDNIPHPGGQDIELEVEIEGTETKVTNGMVLPTGTQIRIDSKATAQGSCTGMGWSCPSACSCEPTGYEYERTINHTNVWADVSTNTGLNGTYSIGIVWAPAGYEHVLDTKAANSSGPNYLTLSIAGSYKIKVQGIINTTPCMLTPNETDVATITIHTGERRTELGNHECDSGAFRVANVTSGNVYLLQNDFGLAGFGEGLGITRAYNSQMQASGLFGYNWWSNLDESISTFGTMLLRVDLPDGRGVYLGRFDTSSPYVPAQPLDFRGEVIKNVDITFTLTFKDGRVHQFNSAGKLVSTTDRNGNTTTYTLNGSGQPVTITDPAGRTVTLTYDSYGLIGSIADSTGTIATYTHGFWGRLTQVAYADGSQYNFSDTFSGNNIYLSSVTDALGNVLRSHTYDSQGRVATTEIAGNGTEKYTFNYVSATRTDVTDALNRMTKYFYDGSKGRNVVTQIEGACSCGGSGSEIQTWTYDDQLNVTSETDALNHTTSYTYDTDGNRLTSTNALGTTTFTYNSFGQVLTVTDPMSGVWTNTYDSQGNLLTVKNPLNHATTMTYGTRGQLLTVTDPLNHTTTFTYDTSGNLTRRTDALNNETDIAYNARGQMTSETNALDEITSYEYDLAGRLKKIIYPDTNFVLFTYDLAGRRTKVKDPRGYETTFAYDGAYRVTSETNAANNVTSYGYDLMSNRTSMTDALNRTTNYFYDDFNRLTKIKYPEASSGAGRLEENFSYDLAGNLITKTDRAGRVTTFCYDNVNRLTSTIDPALKTTAYEYNARSQMTAVVDAINQRYEFVYDAVGQRTQEKKGTATMSFVYDAAGNRTQRTDFNSAVTNYNFDALNRLTTISYPDTTSVTYGYDDLSRMTTATNATGTVTLAYDNRGRVSSVTDVFGQVVSYGYDASSNRTQLSLNAATSATYQYDNINRLTQLADGASLNTTFAYDVTNKLTSRTLPNGVITTSQYDGLNRLTRLTHAKSGTTLADFQYQLDAASNITQMTDAIGVHGYTYDTRDRLTAVTHPVAANESYTLDDVGNRTASHHGSSYTYQTFNRLTAANSNTYGYDANGNLTSKTDSSGSWTYTWDYENRLTQASKSGGVTVNYSYDALGRRAQRTSSISGTTRFVYDGDDVVRDLDGSGATVAEYLNGPGVDNKLRQVAGGNTSYFVSDHLNTTRALADSSGAVVSSISYDTYGNVSSGSVTTRYTYTGREADAEIDLMYYRARWYDSGQGRFISEDPIGLNGGANLFGYVANNPGRFSDPSGLCPGPDTTDDLIRQAFSDASTSLSAWQRKYRSCRDFFTKGRSLEEVSKVFRHFRDTAVFNPKFPSIAGTTNSGQGISATLELGPAFFSDGPPVYQWSAVNKRNLEITTNLTPRQYRALTILHELAHALGLIPSDNIAVDPTGEQSEKNNQTIYAKCGAIIEAAIPWD